MQNSLSEAKYTVGQLLAYLRRVHNPDRMALAEALSTSYTTYLKMERGQREMSFLMVLRLCHFYKLDLYEFISMLSDEELIRNDLSIMRAKEKGERKKSAAKGA